MTPLFASGGSGWLTLVHIVGLTLCAVGAVLAVRILTLKKEDLAAGKMVSLGIVALPALAWYKLVALVTFLVIPPAAATVASYHLFDGIKETQSCMKCHVMQPMGTDLEDPESNTLAARHFRNKWITEEHCYACHTDYGLSGTVAAKMEGFRHLARYTTNTYREPIVYKGTFNNNNCLYCHKGTPKFEAVPSHGTVGKELAASDMSCTNCHGPAHPTRAQRTPGHEDYSRLMKGRR